MSTSMREALEQIRSLSEHGVNNPDEALSQVSSLCDAALSSPEPDGLSEKERKAVEEARSWGAANGRVTAMLVAIIDRLSRQPEAEPVAWRFRSEPTEVMIDFDGGDKRVLITIDEEGISYCYKKDGTFVPGKVAEPCSDIAAFGADLLDNMPEPPLYTSPRLDREKVARALWADEYPEYIAIFDRIAARGGLCDTGETQFMWDKVHRRADTIMRETR